VAQHHGVPPYLIFSDATLQDMAEKRPMTDADMLQVSGVGERKLQLYGDTFIAEIRRYVMEKTDEGANISGSTYLLSWELYKQGESVDDIATTRGLSRMTVMSHLATMYERGELVDLNQWVRPEELDLIQGALSLFEEPYQLKVIYEHFNEKFNYDKIRWAIADFKRQHNVRS
jgi:ATP-dependent DNA helicase RecQ